MVKIAPSILTSDFSNLGEQIKMIEDDVDMLHLDIMDGHFVPNISFGPAVVKSLRPVTNLFFDVHLMVEDPDKFIAPFVDAGADLITVQIEVCKNLTATIDKIKSFNKKIGVALNPDTSIKTVLQFLDKIDMVMFMSVYPGFGGQKFIDAVLNKIKDLREIINKEKIKVDIEVDGGINLETAPQAVLHGANVLVVGSAIYQAKEPKEVIKLLKKL